MLLISVLIVFALEYHFRWGAEYRQLDWFKKFSDFMEGQFGDKAFYSDWGGVLLITFTPVLILYIVVNLFSGPLYSLVLFISAVSVLFLSIGPKPLQQTMQAYFDAMQRGDGEAAYLYLQQESPRDDVPESDEIVRNATRFILIESQVRYFGPVFWFILLGPFGALFYRLSHEYYRQCREGENEDHLASLAVLLHWLDWLPARLTSFLFLLTGDFVNGFYRAKDYLTDLDGSNNQLISESGVAALGLESGVDGGDVKENHDAMALVVRTGILYLVVTAALSPIVIW